MAPGHGLKVSQGEIVTSKLQLFGARPEYTTESTPAWTGVVISIMLIVNTVASLTRLLELYVVTTSLENDLVESPKAEHMLPYDPAVPLLGICPTEMCAYMFAKRHVPECSQQKCL